MKILSSDWKAFLKLGMLWGNFLEGGFPLRKAEQRKITLSCSWSAKPSWPPVVTVLSDFKPSHFFLAVKYRGVSAGSVRCPLHVTSSAYQAWTYAGCLLLF